MGESGTYECDIIVSKRLSQSHFGSYQLTKLYHTPSDYHG